MANEHQWYKDEQTGQYVQDAAVSVNAPVETCFTVWSDYENFPELLTHVISVKKIGDNRWHWVAEVGGQHAEWDAETTEFIPNKRIAWKSVDGLRNSGWVEFHPSGTGCHINVHLMYDPPYGFIGDMVAENNFNDNFHKHLHQDLLNFKDTIESQGMQGFRRAA